MPCSMDHSSIMPGGFCTVCGLRIEEAPIRKSTASISYCPNGHAASSSKKFCETCGATMTGFAAQGDSGYSSGGATSSGVSAYLPPAPPQQSAGYAALPHSNSYASMPVNLPMPYKKNNIGLFIGLGVAGLIIFVIILSVVLGSSSLRSASSGGVFSPSTTTVSVTMSIEDEYCDDLSWGYDDIPGGAIILSVDGVATGFANYSYYGTDTSTGCDFDAYFYDIPTNGTFYSLRMASGLRGTIENDKSEMEYNGWHFDVSLG